MATVSALIKPANQESVRRVDARVEGGRVLLVADDAQEQIRTIPLDTPEWFAWLGENRRFSYLADGETAGGEEAEKRDGKHTGKRNGSVALRLLVQSELRRGRPYWYAYMRRNHKLHKLYLGASESVTAARMRASAAELLRRTLTRAPDQPEPSNPVDAHVKATQDGAEAASDRDVTANSTAGMGARNEPVRRSYMTRSRAGSIYALLEGDGTVAAPAGVSSTPANTPATASAVAGAAVLALSRLTSPPLPDHLVVRPRLINMIGPAVTLVCAPSGFGKTTLVSEWRQSIAMPVAWVQLDKEDDDPLRFWFVFATALQRIDPALGHTLQNMLDTRFGGKVNQIAIAFSNELLANVQGKGNPRLFGLVLDDYHHIEHPAIHASIQVLADNLPPGVRLILISRVRPPLSLANLRARERLVEIESHDLRFTPEEGVGYLNQFPLARTMSMRDKNLLIRQTEGWAAGLHLMILARSRQERRSVEAPPIDGAHFFLNDYFTEAVLHDLPEEMQEFLFRTSVLRQLAAPLCDAVTLRDDGEEMLAHLLQENLFLQRLEEPGWYRYQELFLEMLRAHLHASAPGLAAELHRRAARWLRVHDAPAEAIHHLLACKAWEEAANVIEEMAIHELDHLGEDSQLLRWLHHLPPQVVQQHHTLLKAYLRLSSVSIAPEEVSRFLTIVEANIHTKAEEERTLQENEVLNEINRFRALSHGKHRSFAHYLTDPEKEPVWRMLSALIDIQPFACPDVREVEVLARPVYDQARAQGNLFAALISGSGVASSHLMQGELRRAERAAEHTVAYALERRGVLPEPTSIVLWILSRVYYERNDLDRAQRFLERAMETDPNPASSNILCSMAVQQMKIELALGQNEAAQATIAAIRLLHARRPSGVWSDAELTLYEVWRLIRVGEYQTASEVLLSINEDEDLPLYLYMRGELAFCRGELPLAERSLTALLQRWPHGFHWECVVRARVLLALTLAARGQTGEAIRHMLQSIRDAAGEGMVQPFLTCGLQIVSLLHLALGTRRLSGEGRMFVQDLLRLLDRKGVAGMTTVQNAALLSRREQEVLTLARDGLSIREMAEILAISHSTLKTHLSAIYRKMGVRNRAQAVADASARILLPIANRIS